MPIGDRLRGRHHRGRRLVRWGDEFTSEEVDRDEVDLELPGPSREPGDEEQAEPWGTNKFPERDRQYQEFLVQWRRDHPEEAGDDNNP